MWGFSISIYIWCVPHHCFLMLAASVNLLSSDCEWLISNLSDAWKTLLSYDMLLIIICWYHAWLIANEEASFCFQYHVRRARASLTEADDAFAFLKAEPEADYITYSGFCEALRKVHYYYYFLHVFHREWESLQLLCFVFCCSLILLVIRMAWVRRRQKSFGFKQTLMAMVSLIIKNFRWVQNLVSVKLLF